MTEHDVGGCAGQAVHEIADLAVQFKKGELYICFKAIVSCILLDCFGGLHLVTIALYPYKTLLFVECNKSH